METNFRELIDEVSGQLKAMTKTETVIGEEFELGEYKCKPVIKVGLGFGSGGGTGDDPKSKCKGNGAGAGAGRGITPLGFLVSKGDVIQFVSSNQKGGFSTLFEKMPEMMEKVMEMKKEKEGEKEDTRESKK